MKSILRLLNKNRRRIAGTACRSSADAIEVALVDVETPRGASGPAWELLDFAAVPHPEAVRAEILALHEGADRTRERLTRLHFILGHLIADAVDSVARDAGTPLATLDAVASLGQTICRFPAFPHTLLRRDGPGADSWGRKSPGRDDWVSASTLEIAEPAVIAERLGVPVINNFRARDMAAGGGGGPLFPPVDYILFSHPVRSRLVVHLGGTTRFTALPAGAEPPATLASEAGPGTLVLDALMDLVSGGTRQQDAGGALARKGTADSSLVDEFLTASAGSGSVLFAGDRLDFGRDFARGFLERCRQRKLSNASVLASGVRLIAAALHQAYRLQVESAVPAEELIVTGKGAHNVLLLESLTRLFPEARVVTSDYYGLDVDAAEAVSIALLAHFSLGNKPGNLPEVTGAAHPVILGSLTPGGPRNP